MQQFPVESVSWDDAQLFLAELNKRDNQPGWRYRLPTETEWEYACRGGPMSDPAKAHLTFTLRSRSSWFESPNYKEINPVKPNQANFASPGQSRERPCQVGSFKPNQLGLYDMHGNVCEWCDDVEDNAATRVCRGGCWSTVDRDSRAASRVANYPTSARASLVGLHVARVWVGSAGQ